MKTVIAEYPPKDGWEWDCQCARCGSSYAFDDFYGSGCLSSAEWCKANPLPGRESVSRSTIEWFQVAPA